MIRKPGDLPSAGTGNCLQKQDRYRATRDWSYVQQGLHSEAPV